MYDIQQGVLEL